MNNQKRKAEVIYGEEMNPCPKCGSYNMTMQTPVKFNSDDTSVEALISHYAKSKREGTDYLEGPCYMMCKDCKHKAPAVDCTGRTASDIDNDPIVFQKMKDKWNNQ